MAKPRKLRYIKFLDPLPFEQNREKKLNPKIRKKLVVLTINLF